MTDRLTDDEIKAFRSHQQAQLDELRIYACGNDWPDKSVPALTLRLLDEIEERRRWAVAASRVVVWARALANDPNACVEDLAAAVQELDDAGRKDGGA